jgi:hypothetical protein
MDNPVDGPLRPNQREHGFAIGHIDPVEVEAVAPLELGKARALERWVIVIVQAVYPDHLFTTVEECLGYVKSYESGHADNQNGH